MSLPLCTGPKLSVFNPSPFLAAFCPRDAHSREVHKYSQILPVQVCWFAPGSAWAHILCPPRLWEPELPLTPVLAIPEIGIIGWMCGWRVTSPGWWKHHHFSSFLTTHPALCSSVWKARGDGWEGTWGDAFWCQKSRFSPVLVSEPPRAGCLLVPRSGNCWEARNHQGQGRCLNNRGFLTSVAFNSCLCERVVIFRE